MFTRPRVLGLVGALVVLGGCGGSGGGDKTTTITITKTVTAPAVTKTTPKKSTGTPDPGCVGALC